MAPSSTKAPSSFDRLQGKFEFLKRGQNSPLQSPTSWAPGSDDKVSSLVKDILEKASTEEGVLDFACKFDKWPEGQTVLLSAGEIEQQTSDEFVPPTVKADIKFQQEQIRRFAELQKKHGGQEFECETAPGVFLGQRVIPVETAGCYVPGGRYSHVSSASMSVVTAKVAGVKNVIACSPPLQGQNRMHPSTLYAMKLAGADHILCCGGAHAISAMYHGLFTGQPADILVGPGNTFVNEAKRLLFGRCGIDQFAGPTEILIVADETADPYVIATDLVSQCEHGPTSPAWLACSSMKLAKAVLEKIPEILRKLPESNPCHISWEDWGEIAVLKENVDVDEKKSLLAALADVYCCEHTEVHCAETDKEYYLKNITNYGSLFLGEETCVTYGDKSSGTNHTLPTLRGGRFSGGLSVDKFTKKLTYQRMNREGSKVYAAHAARVSRVEGMEGHALAADCRLQKYFPNETFDVGKDNQGAEAGGA